MQHDVVYLLDQGDILHDVQMAHVSLDNVMTEDRELTQLKDKAMSGHCCAVQGNVSYF